MVDFVRHVTNNDRKILVIGLDAVPSKLILNDMFEDLPTISRMVRSGIHGMLKSCHPPITVPAWMVMMTSKDPGTLGIYGFKHRRGYSYGNPWIVDSTAIKHDRVWDILSRYGKRSIVIGVPPAYPPYEINGKLVSCFLTPSSSSRYVFPDTIKDEIENITNGYRFDVVFRTQDRDAILAEIYDMTEKRFKLIKNWLVKEDWDFFMFMEIGTDRLHHAFWKFYDKTHPKYEPSNPYERVIPDYYIYIDTKIGEIMDLVDSNTIVILASDHGTMSMNGAFCINEWLIQEGYLVLKEYPSKVTEIDKANIDWEKTTAWGWGGYYARIFLNIEGRESNGMIKANKYGSIREELTNRIKCITDPDGRKMSTRVFKPDELYKMTAGDLPDLMVYLDDLSWRSAGTIGHKKLYLSENDTGPDDSVHSLDGFFVIRDPKQTSIIESMTASIYDIAPTILSLLELPIPADMQGNAIKRPDYTVRYDV
jgi:predicted AlkP superfamily phosphohydrolase/phosphomutase